MGSLSTKVQVDVPNFFEKNKDMIADQLLENEVLFRKFYHIRWFHQQP